MKKRSELEARCPFCDALIGVSAMSSARVVALMADALADHKAHCPKRPGGNMRCPRCGSARVTEISNLHMLWGCRVCGLQDDGERFDPQFDMDAGAMTCNFCAGFMLPVDISREPDFADEAAAGAQVWRCPACEVLLVKWPAKAAADLADLAPDDAGDLAAGDLLGEFCETGLEREAWDG